MRRPHRAYLIGGGALLLMLVIAMLFAPQLTRVSPNYWDARTSILLGLPPFAPEPGHLFGTDQYGRDIWSRVVYGTRWSMLFAFLIMAGRLAVAAPAALLGAFGPRRLGWLVERCYVITSAIPPLLVYILVLGAPQLRLIGLGPSVVLTVLLLTLIEWPRVAVALKGRLEGLMAEPFIEGAVATGDTRWQLFKNHLFPHLWPVLLQLVAAEMARALLAIAQLAIFGILVGGGVVNVIDNGYGKDQYVLTTGIPEWGSLLADGRSYTLSKPWIPLVPACAFLIGVVGFSLFSQGLETLLVSIQAIKDATTARLSRRWRWAWVVVTLGALLWYFQGLPWTRAAGIADLAMRQADALTERAVPAFAATLAPQAWGMDPDLSRWAAQLAATQYERVTITPGNVRISGSRATATWAVEIGYHDKSPTSLEMELSLVRRFGKWFVTGEPFTILHGFHADVVAQYDPVDPKYDALSRRWRVQYIATAADHAFDAVSPLFPGQAGAPRPRLLLYTTNDDYVRAVGQTNAGTISYVPDEPIRVSPNFLSGNKRWDIERSLALELIKYLTKTRLGRDQADPLVVGTYDLSLDKGLDVYRIDVQRLAGQRLLTLPDLYTARMDQLTQAQMFSYVVQSALLAEFAQSRLGGQVTGIAGPDELAARLELPPAELAAQYWRYMLERIYSESLLAVPGARPRIPVGLAEAITARAAAATAGHESAFLGAALPGDQAGHAAWLASARAAGLAEYRATLMDFQSDGAKTDVLVLEEITFRDGRKIGGVVRQPWTKQADGTWAAGPVSSLSP